MIGRPGWRTSQRSVRRALFILALFVLGAAAALLSWHAHSAADADQASTAARGGDASAALQGKGAPATTLPTLTPPLQFASTSGPTVAIPILVYHFIRVVNDPKDRLGRALSVTPADFAAQLDYLKAHGVRSLTPDEFYQALQTGRQPQGRVVLLTFDDGFADFATAAAPLLRSHGFAALAYVVSGFIGTPGYMTAGQIRGVERLGMFIGVHTVHHVPLAEIPESAAITETRASKAAVEQMLGHPVPDFSYPYGSFNPAVEAQVKAAGFRTAVTTLPGRYQAVADPFALHRIHVNGGETLGQFAMAMADPAASPPPPPPH